MDTTFTPRGYRIPVKGNESITKDLTIYSTARMDYPGPKPRLVCYKKYKGYLIR